MPLPILKNLYHDLPVRGADEAFEPLVEQAGLLVERIVSQGHVTAADAWYDQERPEWVLLLQGEATLRFADAHAPLQLVPGDYILIPAHCRHRVEATSSTPPCVWLAIHYREERS